MNPFVDDHHILVEKRINMLSNVDKSTSTSIPINFNKSNPSNPLSKCSSSERRLSLTKSYSCSDTMPSTLTGNCSFIIPKEFVELISQNSSTHDCKCLPIVDCRSQIDYGCERIRSSHNVNCRAKLMAKKLLTKRLEDVEPNLSTSLNNSESIIIYDQSTDVRGEDKIRSLPINLVVQAAKRSNKKVYIIQGGFDAVKNQYPHLIEYTSEVPNENFEQNYVPPSPDTVDKENFVMTEVVSRIYVGNVHDAQNFARLTENGITHIVNSTPDLPCFWEDKCQYLRVDVLDLPSQNIRKHFDQAYQFIDDALRTKTNKVLVHCSAGISRSPTIVLAYMIKKQQMKLDDAFQKMRQFRQIVDPNVSFIIQLRDWEKKCLTLTNPILTTTGETNDEILCNNTSTRSTAATYCGSTSKTKSEKQPRPDSAITVN